MQRLRVRLVVVVLVVVVAGATLAYKQTYGTWWQTPDRVSYCERTYGSATPGLSLDAIENRESKTALPGDTPYPVTTVGKVPPVIGRPLLAAVTPAERRRQLGAPCSTQVYLKTGTDTYTAYTLLGGP